ncbi:MmgE/PrpD family protein [Thermodesulfobacteriota bacterium]
MDKKNGRSITEILGRFVSDLSYDKLPKEVINRAKNVILDLIGTAIAGRDLPYSAVALEMAENSRGESTIFTHKKKASAADAAFANAVMGSVLAQDDVIFTFHPGVVNVPAAIAVAEQEQSSGAELITSVVAGYDVMARIFLGAKAIRMAFRDGSVFGPFGAAAVSGKLLKFNEKKMADALGLAANMGGGLRQWVLGGKKERDIFDPMGSRNGVIAATLAMEGIESASESMEGTRGFYQAFSGTTDYADLACKDLGTRFLIIESRYKPYPVCWLTQGPIELSLGLSKQYNIHANDIDSVTARLSYEDATHAGSDDPGPFVNPTQPLLSNQFAIAASFLRKPVASAKFYYEQYDDSEVGALAMKVKVIGEKGRVAPRIEVRLNDGKEYSAEKDISDELVQTDGKIITKFNNHVLDIVGKNKASEIIEIVSNLDKIRNVRHLTEKLW